MAVFTGTNSNNTINGTISNDTIFGLDGHDVLNGNAGDDRIYGGDGNDTINAGSGNDTIDGGKGWNYLSGGAGNDVFKFNINDLEHTQTYDYINDFDTTTDKIDLSDFSVAQISQIGSNIDIKLSSNYTIVLLNTTLASFQPSNIIGTVESVNYVTGDINSNLIGGAIGDTDDYIYAGDGNDTVYGYSGNDQIYGEAGNDALVGFSGTDFLNGGEGDDYLEGNQGADLLFGGAGNDRLYGGKDSDILIGNIAIDTMDGNDTLIGGNGADIIIGNAGNSYAEGGNGTDFIAGGTGDDLIYGNADHDILLGDDLLSAGNDTLVGGDGNDIIYGGGLNDYIEGGNGHDVIIGGTGQDALVYFNGHTGTDLVVDFNLAEDHLNLISYGFSSLDDVNVFDLGALFAVMEELEIPVPDNVNSIIDSLSTLHADYETELDKLMNFDVNAALDELIDGLDFSLSDADLSHFALDDFALQAPDLTIPAAVSDIWNDVENIDVEELNIYANILDKDKLISDGDSSTLDHTLVVLDGQLILLVGISVEEITADNIWV